MSSRYSSRFPSHASTPSSSAEFTSSRALARTKSSDAPNNFTSLVKRLVSSGKPKPNHPPALFIPPDLIAEDVKKMRTKPKGSAFTTLPRKLFQKGSGGGGGGALTEVKANTRTLAMVLRSERELLNQNKEYESRIAEFKLVVEGKNREVEKLKDLCLKQREEIKALKSAILFPDVMNSQLHGLLEKQGSELQQAKQVIPTLQRQVTSLTGQLQCLADDLAEVKADKYGRSTCFEANGSSPGTPRFNQEGTYSLEFSCGDQTSPGSPDVFLNDFNPCLTPYSAKSKEFNEIRGYDYGSNTKVWNDNLSQAGKTSKSSEYCQRRESGNASRAFRWSNESKQTCGSRRNTSFND